MRRLIDQMEVIEEIRQYITEPNVSDDESEIKGFNDGLELAISVLSGMQIVEAIQERKKGRWIDKDGGLATCSECGDRWGVWSVMNFCPNCGCAMTEGAEE